jgi:3-oxoacyl-[acyl-carrier-protein] synthase III
MNVKVVATGRYLPERIETNEELAPRLGVTPEWIVKHAGVTHRHISDEPVAVMAARAAKEALGGGPAPDLIINASGVAQQVLPDTSVFIQETLGLTGIPCFSVHATCLSFAVALHNAASLLQVGAYHRILLVSADLGHRGRNFDEPESSALLGDGAAAVVLEVTPAGEPSALLGFHMNSYPKGASLTEVRGGGTRQHPQDPTTTRAHNLFHMNGPAVYKMALRHTPTMFRHLYAKCGVDPKDIQLVIPHQGSGPAVEAVARFGFDPSIVINRVREEGNCVAASMPMALAYAHESGRLKRGDLVLLCGTGAGLSVLGLVLRW